MTEGSSERSLIELFPGPVFNVLAEKALEGTPWATVGPTAGVDLSAEQNALLQAGCNLYHASSLFRDPSSIDRRDAVSQGILAGHRIERIVEDIMARGIPITPHGVVSETSRSARAIRSALITYTVQLPGATARQATQHLHETTHRLLLGSAYPPSEWRRLITFLTQQISDSDESQDSVINILMHHFSDEVLTPPFATPSEVLAVALDEIKYQYQAWAGYTGIVQDHLDTFMDSWFDSHAPQSLKHLVRDNPSVGNSLKERLISFVTTLSSVPAADRLSRPRRIERIAKATGASSIAK